MSTNPTTPSTPPKPRRPTTPAQQAAARRNGAKSRGPITAEGKLNSRQNAVTHGFTAKVVTLNHESDELFILVLAALENDLRPITELEHELVDNMALARWRAMRTWSHEKAVLDRAMDEALRAAAEPHLTPEDCGGLALRRLADSSRVLTWLDRNENRFHRIFHRSLRELQRLRDERSKAQRSASLRHQWRTAGSGEQTPKIEIENDKTNPANDSEQTPTPATIPADPTGTKSPSLDQLLNHYIPSEILAGRLAAWRERQRLRLDPAPPEQETT